MRLLHQVLIALVAVSASLPALADESADRLAIVDTVQALFDAMAQRDGDGASRTLIPEGRFIVVDGTGSEVTTAALDHADFVERVAASEVPLIERAWDPEVRLDGDIASYRARYDFHSGTQYSHCGVDLFTLVRTGPGWRISGGTFTREQTCPDNPLPAP